MSGHKNDKPASSSDDQSQDEEIFQRLLKKHTDLRVELHYNKKRQDKVRLQLEQWKSKVADLKEDCKLLKIKCDALKATSEGKQLMASISNPQWISAAIPTEHNKDDGEQNLNIMPLEYRSHHRCSEMLCLYDFARHYRIEAFNPRLGKSSLYSCRYLHQTPIYWHVNQMASQFPQKFCKYSALCQVTREFADRGKMELAEKLYEKIWEDPDGFFELK